MNPQNFLKFMHRKDNIKKDARNKAIARKVHQRQEDEAFKGTAISKQFQSAWSIAHPNKRPKNADQSTKDIDQILNVLEIVNKEAVKTGLGGSLHGPASKMLNGLNMLRSAK